jgi:hypothetical protein
VTGDDASGRARHHPHGRRQASSLSPGRHFLTRSPSPSGLHLPGLPDAPSSRPGSSRNLLPRCCCCSSCSSCSSSCCCVCV